MFLDVSFIHLDTRTRCCHCRTVPKRYPLRHHSPAPPAAFQPLEIQASALQVFVQNPSVHNDLGIDVFQRWVLSQVGRGDGTPGAHGQHGELSIAFQNGRLYVAQLEVSLPPAQHHEFAQIQPRLIRVLPVQFSVVENHGRRKLDVSGESFGYT